MPESDIYITADRIEHALGRIDAGLRAALRDRDGARAALAALLDAECGAPATCTLDAHRAAYAVLAASLTYEALTGDHP